MMGRRKNNDHDISGYENLGPALASSPSIAVPQGDPLLARLAAVHGRDVRRHFDDLTSALRAAALAAKELQQWRA